MNLYDETDLISNITGDYVDKIIWNGNRLLKIPNPSILHQPLEGPYRKDGQ